MAGEEHVLVLFATVVGAVLTYDGYSYCTHFRQYNILVGLIHNDKCTNIDSVFKLLADLTTKEGSDKCRINAIARLSDAFKEYNSTPIYCHCKGTTDLQQYYMGPGHNVSDYKDHCRVHDAEYRRLYNQFFELPHSHYVPVCRTHHSLWKLLKNTSTQILPDGNSSCQKDIIFHVKYAFEQHRDSCSCSKLDSTVPSPSNGQQENHGTHYYDHHCRQLDSFNKLQHLGNSDGCLSANSVWHYLGDLEVNSRHCRERILRQLADKYRNATSQDGDACTCRVRGQLVNHVMHRLSTGGVHACKQASDDYVQIRTDLSFIKTANSCKNHNYLWNRLEHVQNYCSHHDQNNVCTSYVDCTRDIISRGANHYPTDDSDQCVCEKTTVVHTTPSKDPVTQTTLTPSTTVTPPMASATSRKAAHVSTTTVPIPSKFSCDKQAVIEDIANSVHVAHPDSSPCDPSDNGTDDAYVLSVCKMTPPSTWRKGANVMSDCESATQVIPTYTPISTFNGDDYNPLGAQSGIFLGCSNNGIKMAIQKCKGVPIFILVESGMYLENPKSYFVIN